MSLPRTIRLVLDTTAVTSWVHGSIAVGETLVEINDEDGAAIIPLWCLIEAGHEISMIDRERLDLLLAHPTTFLVGDDAGDWEMLAALRSLTGRADAASAAWLALDADVDVMTGNPGWYEKVDGGRLVLEIED